MVEVAGSIVTTHSSVLHCTQLAMDRLFSPCTRLRDIVESQGRLPQFDGSSVLLQELKLEVSIDDLLSAGRAFTYADLYDMLGDRNKVAWLTPHAAVVRQNDFLCSSYLSLRDTYRFSFDVDGESIFVVARSSAALSEIVDVVSLLLGASARDVCILNLRCLCEYLWPFRATILNAASLAYLMEQCQSLKTLALQQVCLNEDHVCVVDAYSRLDLEIDLINCHITGTAVALLAQVLGRNQGPTKLHFAKTDHLVLANGLRGNSRLKCFRPRFSSSPEYGNREVLAIASALRENEGLVHLDLMHCFTTMSNESWHAVCDSLKTHPTLEVLTLFTDGMNPLAPAVLLSRVPVLVDMLKVNMSIRTISLGFLNRNHELFREPVTPYLKANRLRPRLLAIQRTRPIAYRAKVLGRALLASRTDANIFWMLLSGNAEVTFPSTTTATTTTTTPAANLPASGNAAAIANAAGIASTASVTVTATRAASTTVVPRAANGATLVPPCGSTGCFYNCCLCCW
jgi:hypothetical protein